MENMESDCDILDVPEGCLEDESDYGEDEYPFHDLDLYIMCTRWIVMVSTNICRLGIGPHIGIHMVPIYYCVNMRRVLVHCSILVPVWYAPYYLVRYSMVNLG